MLELHLATRGLTMFWTSLGQLRGLFLATRGLDDDDDWL